ncbi:MAG: dihydroorotate dehydrogenase-like protein [Acidimicrobiaceae bacterium]|nr:dihydroorotate dehydrogenase-like protein [Ilumatobacter sp.]MCB9379655.1 dihydroorotate dehydrogenase-like protein [Acidimicrobiaceae bacterium]MCO5331546.1 dihydroorotate dehydrogenase-like protein [Ilumatobacteraceae bacterium]
MTDLTTTTYLGLHLRSPLVASAGPLTGNPAMWERLEAAGAAAIVLPSLFEEEIEQEAFARSFAIEHGADVYGEALSYLPDLPMPDVGPAHHLTLVEQARERLSIPVIASLNGTSPGGWVRYARHLADAGANAIELNVYDIVVDPAMSSAEVEERYVELVEAVRAEVDVPIAVKLGPWFSALGNLAVRLQAAGADGLVLFNRLYQPDIDLDTLEVVPRLALSTSAETRLPLHWIANLYGNVDCSLAATSGVHDGADALKLLLAGADVVMTTSSLLKHGPEHLAVVERFIREWMEERDYESVGELRGSVSRRNVADPQVYERQNYYQVLHSWVPERPR